MKAKKAPSKTSKQKSGINPFHLPFRKFNVHLSGSNHPSGPPQMAEETPSHSITLIQPDAKDRSKDQMYFNNMLIHKKNWNWQFGNTNLVWSQGSGDDYLGGSLHMTPNHTEGHAMVQMGAEELASDIKEVSEMTFAFKTFTPGSYSTPNALGISFNQENQQFEFDKTDIPAWSDSSNFTTNPEFQVTMQTINMPTAEGDNILQYVFQFCDIKNQLYWQPWVPPANLPADPDNTKDIQGYVLPSPGDSYKLIAPTPQPSNLPNYIVSVGTVTSTEWNEKDPGISNSITVLTFDFDDDIPTSASSLMPYKMNLFITNNGDSASANGAVLITSPVSSTPEYYCVKGNTTKLVENPQNNPDKPSTKNYLDLLRNADTFQKSTNTGSNGTNNVSGNVRDDFAYLLNYYVYNSDYNDQTNAKYMGLNLSEPQLSSDGNATDIRSIGKKQDSFYNNLVIPMLVNTAPQTDIPNTLTSRRQMNKQRADHLMSKGITTSTAFADQANELYNYEYNLFQGATSANGVFSGGFADYFTDQDTNKDQYAAEMKNTLCVLWKTHIINNFQPCLSPEEWTTASQSAWTQYYDPGQNYYGVIESEIEQQEIPDSLTMLKVKLRKVDQLVNNALNNNTYWALKVFMYLIGPTYQNHLSHISINGGNDSQLMFQQIQCYNSLLNFLTNSNNSLDATEATEFSKLFMETVTSNMVFTMAESADFSKMDESTREMAAQILKSTLTKTVGSASSSLAGAINDGWSQFSTKEQEQMIFGMLDDFGSISRNFLSSGSKARLNNILDQFDTVLTEKLGELTGGKIAKGALSVLSSVGGLAVTTASVFSFVSALTSTKFSKMNGWHKAIVITRGTELCMNATQFVVTGAARSYETYKWMKVSTGAEEKLWAKLKLFNNQDLRDQLVGESSSKLTQWLGNGKSPEHYSDDDTIENQLTRAETEPDAMDDWYLYDVAEGPETEPIEKSTITRLFGKNMDDFMATRFGTVISAANTVFSVYQMVEDIKKTDDPAGVLQDVADGLFVANSAIEFISAAAGWAGIQVIEGTALATVSSFFGFLGPAAAIGGALIDVGLLIYHDVHKSDPFKSFVDNDANDYPYDPDNNGSSVTIDYTMPHDFAIESFCFDTQVSPVIQGTSFESGSNYLQLSSAGVKGTVTQSNDFDTVLAVSASFDGSVQIFTKDPTTGKTYVLRVDESGALTSISYQPSQSAGTSGVADDTGGESKNNINTQNQQWAAIATGGTIKYNKPKTDVEPESISGATFTLQNVGNSKYLVINNGVIGLSSSSTGGLWSVTTPSMRPDGLSYNQSGYSILGLQIGTTYSPTLIQGNSSGMTYQMSGPGGSQFSLQNLKVGKLTTLEEEWYGLLDMDTFKTSGVIGLRKKSSVLVVTLDSVKSLDVSVLVSDTNGTSNTVQLTLQSAVGTIRPMLVYGNGPGDSNNAIYLNTTSKNATFAPTVTQGSNIIYSKYTGPECKKWPSFLSLSDSTGDVSQNEVVSDTFAPISFIIMAKNDYGTLPVKVIFTVQSIYGSTYQQTNLLNVSAGGSFPLSPSLKGYKFSGVVQQSGLNKIQLPTYIKLDQDSGEITIPQGSDVSNMKFQPCIITAKGTDGAGNKNSETIYVDIQSVSSVSNNMGVSYNKYFLKFKPGNSYPAKTITLSQTGSGNAISKVMSVPSGFKIEDFTFSQLKLSYKKGAAPSKPKKDYYGDIVLLVYNPTYGYSETKIHVVV